MNRRHDIEQRERQTLAGYAALAAESKGRVYPQDEHPLRTAYQRDRDRIIHSAAFRRMEYKTQVFIPHLVDHYRTRLTHSIEVAQISRSLARNLGLNEDLTEAVALVHDLGHTPFGHSGEEVLNDLLATSGGFNHNRQSLRVVDILEQRYPDHPGLNLTYEVREGIAKHESRTNVASDEFESDLRPTLEASLVDRADELAYTAHDIDDGINSKLISLDDLSLLAEWEGERNPLGKGGTASGLEPDELRYSLVRFVIDRLASDLLEATRVRLDQNGIVDLPMLRRSPEPLCDYSESVARQVRQLKALLNEKLYHHPQLVKLAEQSGAILRRLFERLMADPALMPRRYQAMLDSEQVERVVADYIAGMTDRFATRLDEQLR